MGGGHGPHIVGNEKNMQESDEAMLGKIQRIELVKFNPNHLRIFLYKCAPIKQDHYFADNVIKM